MVDDSAVTLPLRALVRIATPEDCQAMQDNRKKEPRAFEICQQKIKEYNLDMKLVRVEYSFDGNKILFFFTSEGRVDFRELVKNLASIFRTRIELRQIGVRDEAKLLGGLGVCGKPFCCATFLDEFQPVSIKMAKTQNLSLNPVKISGTCGRLMCCLKYEQEAYEDLLKRAPKQESFVNTPEGTGTVSTVSLLREQVKVRLDAAPETPKCFRNEEISVIRSGKGKRPEGYDSPEEIRANWLKQMQEAALARQMEEAQARESARKAMESMGKKAEGKPSHEGRRRPEGQSQRPNPPKHPEQAGQEDAQQREQKPNHGKRRRPHRQKPRDQKPQEAKPQGQKVPEQKPREQKSPEGVSLPGFLLWVRYGQTGRQEFQPCGPMSANALRKRGIAVFVFPVLYAMLTLRVQPSPSMSTQERALEERMRRCRPATVTPAFCWMATRTDSIWLYITGPRGSNPFFRQRLRTWSQLLEKKWLPMLRKVSSRKSERTMLSRSASGCSRFSITASGSLYRS
jgi:cell fate regulator YaaT (PSP1 superfamily)